MRGFGIREKIRCGLRFFGVFLCGFAVFGPPLRPPQRDVKGLQHEVDNLKMQLLYQEHYSIRENLMFIGIQEEVSTKDGTENSTVSNQNTENTQEIISNFVEQELQIQMLEAELISNTFTG